MGQQMCEPSGLDVAATGIRGFDEILGGGFPRGHVYLVEGSPGAGKTTLAIQFSLEGVRLGEKVLFITLSETKEDLHKMAKIHGWDFAGIEIEEVFAPTNLLEGEMDATMFNPSELELSDTTRQIVAAVERVSPDRVVFDSLTEIRLQAQTTLRYRREVVALRRLLASKGCTTLFLDELESEITAQSVVHGIIEMERESPGFGPTRRRIHIAKLRNVSFFEGYHDFVICKGGSKVYPRLVAAEHREERRFEPFDSGLPELDELIGGGLPAGTTSLFIGMAGSGKSSAASQFVFSAAKQKKRAAIYLFDESLESFFTRCRGLGMDLEPYAGEGTVFIQPVDPGELSPGQFTSLIRTAVEEKEVEVLVVDSLNGYLHAMPEENFLIVQLHELSSYLNQKGVMTIFNLTQSGIVGEPQSPIDMTYLADNVVFFRQFEAFGEVRKSISVLKKRSGSHEKTIRELKLSSAGLSIGEPLSEFQGILTGSPVFTGREEQLMKKA